MKVAYLAHLSRVSYETGVLKKIIAQLVEWKRQGVDAHLFLLAPDKGIWEGLKRPDVTVVVGQSTQARLLIARRWNKMVDDWQPDAIYLRFTSNVPGLTRLVRKYPTIAELNSDDVTEYARTHTNLRYKYHLLTRKALLSACSAFIYIAYEFAPRFAQFAKPYQVIGNAMPQSLRSRPPGPPSSTPRLVFIGSPGYDWHGLTSIIAMARAFKDWRFDIIGFTRSDIAGQVSDNMNFHGYLTYSGYQELMNMADIGIGTLALYEKQSSEASPLKVREYLAHGLPVIIGYQDTDFPNGAEFILNIPNREHGVSESLGAIDEFVAKWLGRRVPTEGITHLSLREKEAKRIEFISDFASPREPN